MSDSNLVWASTPPPPSDFHSTHTIRRSFLQSLISPQTLASNRYDLGFYITCCYLSYAHATSTDNRAHVQQR